MPQNGLYKSVIIIIKQKDIVETAMPQNGNNLNSENTELFTKYLKLY